VFSIENIPFRDFPAFIQAENHFDIFALKAHFPQRGSIYSGIFTTKNIIARFCFFSGFFFPNMGKYLHFS